MMDELISKLSEIRSEYNCFDKDEEPQYRALSEVIKILSKRADGDTISRQEAIDEITELCTHYTPTKSVTHPHKDFVIEELTKLPSAQKTGRWIWDDEGYHCSECFFHAYGNTLECMDGIYRYCPNCGCRMEVEHERTEFSHYM